MPIVQLIQFIVWYAKQLGIPLTTNRLVKYLYLLDCFNARLHSGDTLTHLPWAFVSFGPYCRQAGEAISDAVRAGLINQKSFESFFGGEKEYHLFSCSGDEGEQISDQLDIRVSSKIKAAMKHFGEDTPALLDFIYFDTEPMAAARKKGDHLDFSLCVPPPNIKIPKTPPISKEKKEQANVLISRLVEKMRHGSESLMEDEKQSKKWKDESYYQALDAMNSEDLPVGLKGSAKIGD